MILPLRVICLSSSIREMNEFFLDRLRNYSLESIGSKMSRLCARLKKPFIRWDWEVPGKTEEGHTDPF